MKKHNLKLYTNETLINLCKKYTKCKDIPRWLYSAIRHRGIQGEALKHIKENYIIKIEDVRREALKYKTRTEFQRGAYRYYHWAYKHNLLDAVCTHMDGKYNVRKRCIYIGFFEDGYAYIGLTCNTTKRWRDHMSNSQDNISPIFLHHKETGLMPTFEQLTDYVSAKNAQELEKFYIRELSSKWKLLNTSTGGELGSVCCKWTKENILLAAQKCYSYKEFISMYPSAYGAALKNNWLKDIQEKLPKDRRNWGKEDIEKIFEQCNSIEEVYKMYGGACEAAKRIGIYENLSKKYRIQHKTYTKQEIVEYAKKFRYKIDFLNSNRSMFNAAIRLGIYKEIIDILETKPHGKTIEEYITLASSYKSRSDFKKEHPGAYAVIISKDGWADKCFGHMRYKCRVNLSDREILNEALKYKTKNEWQKNDPGGYNASKKRGLFDLATKHMQRPIPHNKISDDFLVQLCSKYNNLAYFRKQHPNEYSVIVRRGKNFMDVCFKNMTKKKHFYTKEEAMRIAKEYSSRTRLFKENNSVYYYLNKNDLLDVCFPLKKK